ncbi:multiple wing hairs isoform X2 [Oratosquilla oratoria]|uniref:multiple wing hairs isoform X2 n=1 Tax=Oratosquilla oratoria TaxID=337810 RepID=UPI003F76AE7A
MEWIIRRLTNCLKFSCVEDEVEMRMSEDEGVVEPEDASLPLPHHRPPLYNTEDYAHALYNYSRMTHLYLPEPVKDKKARGREKEKNSGVREAVPEMSMKQFNSLPELLRKLREDLKMSYLSFVKELVRDPHDGVTLLLDVLKMIQLSQTDISALGLHHSREHQTALRRALIDEHECLSCLRYCLRSTDAALKVAHYPHGLYTLAVATMSNLARSRTLALQLLTRACETSPRGHRQVVEALATLRLRFAEPVKCKFLVSMMHSHPHPSFQMWALRFLNALLLSCETLREKVYLQEEMVEAGFDPNALRKVMERGGVGGSMDTQEAMKELDRWVMGYVDLNSMDNEMRALKHSNTNLHDELKNLREANMKLLEENVILKAVGGEVEERCVALQRRLEVNGLPTAPSPAPSTTDSDFSSFSTIRNLNDNRPSSVSSNSLITGPTISPQRKISSTSSETPPEVPPRTTSMIQASENISSHLLTHNSTTPEGSQGLSAGGRRHGLPLNTPPPIQQASQDPTHDDQEQIVGVPDAIKVAPEYENNRVFSSSEDRYNEHMPVTHIDMTFRNDSDRHRSLSPESHKTSRSDSQLDERESRSSSRDSRLSVNNDKQNITGHPDRMNRHNRDKSRSSHRDTSSSGNSSSSTSTSRSPSSKAVSPSTVKRKAPKSSPPSGSNNSFSSSSTSSLSSSSSTSSTGGERKDPEYMNVPRSKSRNGSGEDGELDYERDMIVYEAITLGNDTIVIDKSATNSSKSSDKSVETIIDLREATKTNSRNEGPSVRKSVQHYENLVVMNEQHEAKEEHWYDGEMSADSLSDIENRKRSNGDYQEVSEREVEAVMSGLENVLRSAESSLSLASQETVKENPLLSKEKFEDRASPDRQADDEIEIVPTRVPQLPAKNRSRTSSNHPPPPLKDPVLFLEYESPAETSDTESILRSNQPLSSPRTIETESTKSFGFVRPDKSIRRHETFMERGHSAEKDLREERRRGLRRSESFQMGKKTDYNSHRSYSPRRRGSMEVLVPMEEREVHISGRIYTKHTPHEVERRNRVNELITAELNRRKNRSMEERLDEWFDGQGDDEWTLKWKYPVVNLENGIVFDESKLKKGKSKQQERRSSRRKHESRLPEENDRKSPRHPDGKSVISSSSSSSTKYVEAGRPVSKPTRPSTSTKTSKFTPQEITAFGGFKNPNGFRESDYGPNFMLNKPSNRLGDFGDFADYGGPDYQSPRKTRGSENGGRDKRLGREKRKEMVDPDIPTPDYSSTPAGTLTNNASAKHILDMPSGLY